ncbi:uncharacterized protein RJT21DRAFT_5589 [Scheffersomyces amazonensis]|uniref:uncharacterized protein n=1 Tax=Scheffersomyces amazonensis TaxID=1078765 RepID=UPI00315D0C6C
MDSQVSTPPHIEYDDDDENENEKVPYVPHLEYRDIDEYDPFPIIPNYEFYSMELIPDMKSDSEYYASSSFADSERLRLKKKFAAIQERILKEHNINEDQLKTLYDLKMEGELPEEYFGFYCELAREIRFLKRLSLTQADLQLDRMEHVVPAIKTLFYDLSFQSHTDSLMFNIHAPDTIGLKELNKIIRSRADEFQRECDKIIDDLIEICEKQHDIFLTASRKYKDLKDNSNQYPSVRKTKKLSEAKSTYENAAQIRDSTLKKVLAKEYECDIVSLIYLDFWGHGKLCVHNLKCSFYEHEREQKKVPDFNEYDFFINYLTKNTFPDPNRIHSPITLSLQFPKCINPAVIEFFFPEDYPHPWEDLLASHFRENKITILKATKPLKAPYTSTKVHDNIVLVQVLVDLPDNSVPYRLRKSSPPGTRVELLSFLACCRYCHKTDHSRHNCEIAPCLFCDTQGDHTPATCLYNPKFDTPYYIELRKERDKIKEEKKKIEKQSEKQRKRERRRERKKWKQSEGDSEKSEEDSE